MKKTYITPELIDQGSATARTLEGGIDAPEPGTQLEERVGLL